MNPKDAAGSLKSPLGLVPMSALVVESEVLRYGAYVKSYGPYNWRDENIDVQRYIDATLRHVHAWADGQNDDEESGLSHLAHARATLGILIDALSLGCVIDSRPRKGAGPALLKKHTRKKEQ